MALQRINETVSNEELKEWAKKFEEFRTPEELMHLNDELRSKFRDGELFNRSGLTFVLEAHVTATFGQLKKAEKVRLIPQHLNQNDCEIVMNGESLRFEITEIMEEERKRGDEYKNKTDGELTEITEEQMQASSLSGFRQLTKIIKQKASKGYDDSVGLIVYYNVSDFDKDEKFVTEVTKILESLTYSFPTIDFLHNHDIFRFTKDCSGVVSCEATKKYAS